MSTASGKPYAPSVRAHCETVLRSFYKFHLETGSGPVVNPFPLDRTRRGGRAHAHHNPVEPFRHERAGLYRPRVPSRIPRSVPDAEFNEIFAKLPSHRDRALVAFYVSTGARASELLSATLAGVDPGRQVIAVVRKGTRELQELPASTTIDRADAEPSGGPGGALCAGSVTAGRALLLGQTKRPAGRSPFAGIARIRSWGSPFSFSAVWLLSFSGATPRVLPGSSSGPAPSLASQTYSC